MIKRLKPYKQYQNVPLAWLGKLPSHWEIKRAKAMFSKANRPVRDFDEVVTCFRDGTVTLRKNRRTTGFTESIKEVGYQGIRKGDLVIHVMDAFAGAVGVSDSDGKSTPVYSVCIPKEELNNYYYAYIVREMAKTGFIQSLYRGIRERSSDFRFEVFANQYLPVPPLQEQNQIVKYLDMQLVKLNKFINTKKKLISILKEQKQSVITEVVTKGLNPNVKMKKSGVQWIGDIPEHWDRNKITRLFMEIGSGTTPKSGVSIYYDNGNVNWINSGDLNDNYLLETRNKVTTKALEDYSVLKMYPKDTIVIAMYGATIGKLSMSKIEACCNQACCCLGKLNGQMDLEYAFYSLMSCRNYLIEQSKGGGQPNISQDIVKKTWLPIPPKSEQKELVNYIKKELNSIEKTILKVEKEIQLIIEYRACLITDVVTGKFDVSSIEVDELLPKDRDINYIEDDFDDIEEFIEGEECEV